MVPSNPTTSLSLIPSSSAEMYSCPSTSHGSHSSPNLNCHASSVPAGPQKRVHSASVTEMMAPRLPVISDHLSIICWKDQRSRATRVYLPKEAGPVARHWRTQMPGLVCMSPERRILEEG